MRTTLTQKELVSITKKHGIYINPKMSKQHIMIFIKEAILGNNQKWIPVVREIELLLH